MSVLRWMPWRFFVTRIARAYGFLDPIHFLSKLRRFSKPSEVSEPIELLRAGVLFHARGLINTKAIQNNLDWVWPYWVERQFNPADRSFIPRAFSFSHINLTHRNWTAVGLPDVAYYSIVDPRGLLTPLFDGWSLDFWLIGPDNQRLLPSKLDQAEQSLETVDNLRVLSRFHEGDLSISTEVLMELEDHHPSCRIRILPRGPAGTRLAVALRPYNPEGISLIESIEASDDKRRWRVNGNDRIFFAKPAEKFLHSCYKEGDVLHQIPHGQETQSIRCPVSMASGAALFTLDEKGDSPIEVTVPILDELTSRTTPAFVSIPSWREEINCCSLLRIPDSKIQTLYDQAVATLILHSPEDVYPGPYTYKRFWFRDAAFIINALLTLGHVARARRAMKHFPARQTRAGYFLSQEGEWDSNGEAIWIMHRFSKLSGETLPKEWLTAIERGAHWILKKRLPLDIPESHAGLLPAGFSAEHLGPNDHYYWDNFWGVAGLQCAADLMASENPEEADYFRKAARDYMDVIQKSFRHIPDRVAKGAISASPHRRMDAGAVGSIVADYPLQLFPPGEIRMIKTVEYLMDHSFFKGGFFQNMIHSGINAYLTLEIAQVLLRAGNLKALELIDATADVASSTGQWPEAIHPQTGGGCMGDGQHVWAAAEWVLMIRNLFVREETGQLIIGSGLFSRWLEKGEVISFENTLTAFGPVTIRLQPEKRRKFRLFVDGKWRGNPPEVDIRIPGFTSKRLGEQSVFSVEAH